MTTEIDLAAYLTSKGVHVTRAGSELLTHCWNCPDGDPKGKGKLYLNPDSWLAFCFRCNMSLNRKTLLEHFGDEDENESAAGHDPQKRRNILTEAVDVAHEMLLTNDRILTYLTDRGLSVEQIYEARLGWVPKNFGLSDALPSREQFTYKDLITAGLISAGGKEFFNASITIPYFSYGQVVQIREKILDGKYRTMGGDVVRLYNSDSLRGADTVLVTEGEFDTRAVLTQIDSAPERTFGGMAVVGLAGAGSWPEGFIENLTQCRKVFIGLDPDDTGKRNAQKILDEVGTKGRIVELPEGEPKTDWSDFFKAKSPSNPNGGHDWRDLQSLLIQADMEGKRLFSVGDAAVAWEKRRDEAPGIQLGFKSLDQIIRPGLKPGQVFIPFSQTGVGKTLFLNNLVHNTRKHRTLYLSLEMTKAEIYEHMYRIHRFWNPRADRSQAAYDYRNLRIVDQNRLKPGDMEELLDEFKEEVGQAELILVDYLQYFARGYRGNSMYDRVSDAVMDLKAIGKERGAAVIVPSQANRSTDRGKPLSLSGMRDAGTIEETGDFIFGMFRPGMALDADGEPIDPHSPAFNGQILKSRHGGAGRTVNFRLSSMSLAIVDSTDIQNLRRVDQENGLLRQGHHYDDYRRALDEELSVQRLEYAR